MPADQLEVLRQWASGKFYPLSPGMHGRDALEDLADEMAAETLVAGFSEPLLRVRQERL